MARFDPPSRFSFKANEWEAWIREFKRFRTATKLHKEDGEIQRDQLLYCMGTEKAEQVMATFKWGKIRIPTPGGEEGQTTEVDEDDTMFDVLVQKFTEYYIPRRNIIHERSIFNQRVQGSEETVEEFVRDLQNLVKYCKYLDPEDQVRDRFVIGLRDSKLKEKLQLMHDLELQKAIEIARREELVREQLKMQASSVQESLSASEIRSRKYPHQSKNIKKYRSQGRHEDEHKTGNCSRCGGNHGKNYKCPATGKSCNKCKKLGHFAAVCRNKTLASHKTREIVEESNEESNSFYIGAVKCDDDQQAWSTKLDFGEKRVLFKIDTGADVSVMPRSVYASLTHIPSLRPTAAALISPGGRLKSLGEFTARVQRNGITYEFRVVVVDYIRNCLLSRKVSEKMGLIARIEEIERNVFGSCGLMDTKPVKITLRDDAKPYCTTAARNIPFPLMDKVKAELDHMEKLGVIRAVTEPTDWCAPIVPVIKKKKGQVRICVDLKKLNKAVKREYYNLPSFEDVTRHLSGSEYFSTLDAASGFLQIPLDQESSLLTTFITPFGRYCFNRVPFGITSAPEIFQRKMSDLLKGLPGTRVIMDDILVHGRSLEEHDIRLKEVLRTIEASGLKLNKDKCQFRKTQVSYFGHIIGKDGIKPSSEKVRAIQDLKAPTNVSELRSVLGMFNYLVKFIPNLSSVLKPMTNLLKSNTTWHWDVAQQDVFEQVKTSVCNATALAYYDPSKPIVVSADASSYGLGAALFKREGSDLLPIAFASRTLTTTECGYAQIEKECLACVWACEKFSRYLIGLESFELMTDHKPLVPLMSSRDLDKAPVRCQRLLMRLMRFNPLVRHVAGKELVIADALSRIPLSSDDTDELNLDVEEYVEALVSLWPVSNHRLQEIKTETALDKDLRDVCDYVREGWPNNQSGVPAQLKPYFQERGNLSLVDGILTYEGRIIIPAKLRRDILSRIHESHQGLTKCRQNASSSVWWPNISSDLRNLIENCEKCQENRPAQQREPLLPTPLPNRPWEKLGADLFEFKKKNYLVVIDYYSRWIEIKPLPSTSSNAVIGRLKDIFSCHGIPEILHSDNGSQFVSFEFSEFAKKYGFQRVTSSPYFHQSNGEAERAVQTAKKILNQDDPDIALLNYRSTIHSATKTSPSLALMGRMLKTRIPVMEDQLLPKSVNHQSIKIYDSDAKDRYKRDYDRRHNSRPLSPLSTGQSVLLKTDDERKWIQQGTIVKEDQGKRTYLVQTPAGNTLRRNRKHLQLLPDKFSSDESNDNITNSSNSSSPEETVTTLPNISAAEDKLESLPRRSSRTIKKPKRLIEEC